MMKALYRQKGATLDINILASNEAQDFINAHSGVLDASFEQVEMTDTMRQRLTRSDYIFSGIKTFHELNEAFPSMVDPDTGQRKPFERFLNDVQKIDETYNANYLHSEYNFVAASAAMAAKWEQFQQDGDRYYLQYRTAHDDKVRPEHAALEGVTLPMSDPFWETYYPPNGWNCRCTVQQVLKSRYKPTPQDEAMNRGEEAMGGERYNIFRFNSGKQGKAMPDYNPYTIRRCNDCDAAKGKLSLALPDNEVCAACRKIRTCALNRDKAQLCTSKKRAVRRASTFYRTSAKLQTGHYFQSRDALKLGLGHARTQEEIAAFEWVPKQLDSLHFVRFSPLGETKNRASEKDIRNIEKKERRHAVGYNEYEIEHAGEIWQLKMEVRRGRRETLYIAFKKK